MSLLDRVITRDLLAEMPGISPAQIAVQKVVRYLCGELSGCGWSRRLAA